MRLLWYERIGLVLLYLGFIFIGWWPIALLVAIFLLAITTPYELIVFGALVDSYFGVALAIPWYCLFGLLFCCLSIIVRPVIANRISGSIISI